MAPANPRQKECLKKQPLKLKYCLSLAVEKSTALEEKREKFQALRQELITINYQEQELEKKTLDIKDISTCPTCLRPLKNKEAKEIIEHLQKEFQKKIFPQKQKIQKELKILGYDEVVFKKLGLKRQKLSSIEEVYPYFICAHPESPGFIKYLS